MLTYRHTDRFDTELSALYSASFSEIEKVPEENILRTFGRGGDLVEYHDEDGFAGMTFTFTSNGVTFLVYFATVPEKRSRGYGSEILSMVRDMYPDSRLFLVIEPRDPDAEDIDIRIRRHNFYLRNGCTDTGVRVISDDAWFDTMCVKGSCTAEEMENCVRTYEDIHNGRI